MAQYQYDGQGRRIVKKTYTGGTLSETRHFYWSNPWQDLEERVGTSTSPDNQQVWGIRYVDELICRDNPTPWRLYVCQDANFNVTALVDTTASVVERFIYEPYGTSTVLTAAWGSTTDAYAWNWRHQGLCQDPETELIYNRYRILNPPLGRFNQREPYGGWYIDGPHLYQYVKGNPIDHYDSAGLLWPPPGFIAIDPDPDNPNAPAVWIGPNGQRYSGTTSSIGMPFSSCGDEPTYNPGLWNDNGPIQQSNNCYSYAVNDPNNHPPGKPQPGEHSSHPWYDDPRFPRGTINCQTVSAAAIRACYELAPDFRMHES